MEPPTRENTAWPYYSRILGEGWQRGGMKGTWAAIREQAQEQGSPLPTFLDVTRLYSFAASQRNVAERAAKAPDTETNMTPYITPVARSRSLEQRNALPRFTVSYEIENPEEEGGGTQWYERSLGGVLPSSLGEVRQDIEDSIALEEDESPPTGAMFTGNFFIAAR